MPRPYLPSQKPAAYIPFYDNGNCVKVIQYNGEVSITRKGIRSVLKSIVEENDINIDAVKKSLAKYTGRKIILPIPLDIQNILIPVKVRKAISSNDGSFAYINIISIKEVCGNKNAVIKLSCNMTVETIESKKAVMKMIDLGHLLRERIQMGIFGDAAIKEAFDEIAVEYSKPATRGDIAIIARELLYIRNRLDSR